MLFVLTAQLGWENLFLPSLSLSFVCRKTLPLGKYLDEGKIPHFCLQYCSSSLSKNRNETFTPRTTGHKDAIGTGNTEMPGNVRNRKGNNGREERGEISRGLLLPCSTEVAAHRCCQVICSDTCLVHRGSRPFPTALTVSSFAQRASTSLL